MEILRIFIGAIYDLGCLMSALSFLAGIAYSARAAFFDSPSDGATAVTHFVLSVVFWAIARVFRRYAL